MKFSAHYVHPVGYPWSFFLDTTAMPLVHAINELGHDCTVAENMIYKDRQQILLGAHLFTEEWELGVKDLDPIILQTEHLTEEGLPNFGTKRWFYETYLENLRVAKGVWDVMPQNVEFLANHGIKAHLYRGGYHEGLRTVHTRPKEFDFGFYGSPLKYRKSVLDALQDKGCQIRVIVKELPQVRMEGLAQTRIQLCLHQGHVKNFAWQRPSFFLNNHLYFISEQMKYQEWMEAHLNWVRSDDLLEYCHQMISMSDSWRATQCQVRADKYAKEFPLLPHIEQLLDDTF